MSPTFTDLLPPTRSEKHGAFTFTPATDNATSPVAGLLTLTGKRCHCRYRVEESPSDMPGRAFLLFKIDAGSDQGEERYACLVGPHNASRCECRGFASTSATGRGHCKHLAALTALIDAGKL
jgi:hypothetical protein